MMLQKKFDDEDVKLLGYDAEAKRREASKVEPYVGGPGAMMTDDQAKACMLMCGMHVFDQAWTGYHSATFRECRMKVYGSEEEMSMPVQVCTKVEDVRSAIAAKCMVNPETIDLIAKQGCSWRKLKMSEEVHSKVVVKGIKSFKPQWKQWKHPIIFIGAGYDGVQNAKMYVAEGRSNFEMFDREKELGGTAWLKMANKTSRLQTDFAAFHCWFGQEWSGDGTGNVHKSLGFPINWSTWPKRDEVVAHIAFAIRRMGLTPHIKLNHEVHTCQVVGRLTDQDRYYTLNVEDKVKKSTFTVNASIVYHAPGAYFKPRQIKYAGEEESGMHFGFGMHDDMPYDHLEHNRVAILGNGAFAVENIRTVIEFGAEKVYLVTRRWNLACPRLCCWFTHQGIFPTPAGMLLRMYKNAYATAGWGNPWNYWSVNGREEKDTATISSASRFGIGDVTFLACATGRCEYKQDTVKRFSAHTVHLDGGEKLENIKVIVKALGLLADFACDRMHNVRKLVGVYPDGDHRRIIHCDALGMHASNFTTMSAGPGFYGAGIRDKVFVDFPHLYNEVQDNAGHMLPIMEPTENKPAHQGDVKHMTSAGMVIDSACPSLGALSGSHNQDDYMHEALWAAAPLDKVYAECVNSWNAYQEEWKAQGYDHPYVPYPYPMETVQAWFEEYEDKVGPLNLANKRAWLKEHANSSNWAKMMLMVEEGSQGNIAPDVMQEKNQQSLEWWGENCGDTVYKLPGTKSKTFEVAAGG